MSSPLHSSTMAEKLNPDGMVAHYLALADEGMKAMANKQAEMLFATAESDLDDQEDHEAALTAAMEALKLYQESSNKVAIVDTLRTIIKCYCSKLQNLPLEQDVKGLSVSETDAEAKSTIAKATELAEEHLESFKKDQDVRGQAAMNLCLAEVTLLNKEAETNDFVKLASDAVDMCKKSGDNKLEASALLVLVSAYMKMEKLQDAYLTAIKAVTAFRGAEDKKGEAQALHAQGIVGDQLGKDGQACFKNALMICKEAGFQKMEALESHHIAARLIAKDNARLAVPFAREALRIFGEVASGKRWHWTAVGTLGKALVQKGDEKAAIKVVTDAVARSKKADDKAPIIMNLGNLFSVHMSSSREGDPMKAINAAMEAINLSMAEGYRKLEANGRLNLAQVMLRFWRLDLAQHWARTAMGIYVQLGDEEAETDAKNLLVAIYLRGSKFDSAIDIAQDMEAALQKQGRTVREAAASLHMAQAIFQKMVSKSIPEFDSSKVYAWGLSGTDGGVTIAEVAKEPVIEVQLEDAIAKAKQAQAAFQKAGDMKSEAMAWELLAAIEHHDPDEGDAVMTMQKAAVTYGKGLDYRSQAFALQQLAQILKERANADAAVATMDEACACARKTRDLKLEVQMLLALSHAHSQRSLKRLEKNPSTTEWIRGESAALQPAREAVALCRKLKDRYALPVALTVVAEVHCLGGQLNEAQPVVEEALSIYREDWENGDWRMNNAVGEARALVVAAEVYFMQKEEVLARDTLQKANQLFVVAQDALGVQLVKECMEGFSVKESFKPTAMATEMDAGVVAVAASGAVAEVAREGGMTPEVAKLLVFDKVNEAVGDADDLHLDTPLMDAGLDSLAAVSFREDLQKAAGLKLPASIVFDYPDPRSLIDFLVEESAM